MPIIQEPFASGSSWIYRIDPSTKIAAGVTISIEIAVLSHLPTLIAANLLALMLITTARLPLLPVLKRLSVAAVFLLLIWILLPLTYEGAPAFRWGVLTWTRPGIDLAARITLKSTSILMIFMALPATMPIAALGRGLNRLQVPDKLVFLLLMTYRYIFVMADEYQRLSRAARIRGFRPGTNIHTYRTYAYLIGMLFVRAKARADRVYHAMLCRGFNGKFHTLTTVSPAPGLRIGFICFMLCAAVGLGCIEFLTQ